MTVPVAPGAPAEPATAAPVVPTTPPMPAPPIPAAPPAAASVAPAVPAATDDVTKLKADYDRLQADARKHEDRWKERDQRLAQQDALLRTLAEKAGIEVDGKPDPDKLLAQVTSATQMANDRARELAIFRAANGVANADLLLDSRSFMAQTSDLDPSSADFGERVKVLVAQTVAANPTLAAAPPATVPAVVPPPEVVPPVLPAASGADFSGAPAGSVQWTEADYNAASPEAVVKAMDQGLLRQLGYAPRRRQRNR